MLDFFDEFVVVSELTGIWADERIYCYLTCTRLSLLNAVT